MSVILSIKPRYCKEIVSGRKEYEFRRKIFDRSVTSVYMYSAYPTKKIIGIFTIESIIEDHPEKLWDRCQDSSGIEEENFFRYFYGCGKGFAIKIKDVKAFTPFDPEFLVSDFSAPQSFLYVKKPRSVAHPNITEANLLRRKLLAKGNP